MNLCDIMTQAGVSMDTLRFISVSSCLDFCALTFCVMKLTSFTVSLVEVQLPKYSFGK